jgi:hypothetical protein
VDAPQVAKPEKQRKSAELTMPLLPQSEREAGHSLASDVGGVRDKLTRLLAHLPLHPLFANSKRYPVFLTYTVEQTLRGNGSELKERAIGAEAFGRETNDDVNLDPVVRTTAAEVRKRLIQNSYNKDHVGELIIELPVGSYVPLFLDPTVSMNVEGPQLSQKSGIASQDRSITDSRSV